MGIRKNALIKVKDLLNDKPILLDGTYDIDTIGTGKVLRAYNYVVDVNGLKAKNLPLVCILPAPHVIETGLQGRFMDSTFQMNCFGYVAAKGEKELMYAAEDVIEFITQTLVSEDNIEAMRLLRFSIIEFGPILNEPYSIDPIAIAYISIPITVQFVEH